MYKDFYKFSEKPFTLLPDPGFLYMSDKHRMAFTLLEYGLMNHAGFTVISGDIGAGKTTLIRHLLDNMDREHTVGLISNTHRTFGELLHWVLLAFNLDHANLSKVEMYQRFVDFIIDEYAHNRRTVLIVDEAQNMSAETLEELRMLSNINADKDQSLQVILVGQNELRDTLQRPDLVQLAQRISVDYHLQPLSEKETANYIHHRLKVASGRPDTFSDLACKAAHRYSNGVPRLINLLCDTALVYGYAEQKQQIDANLVTQVAKEKQAGGIFPTFVPALDDDFPAEEPQLEEMTIQAEDDSTTAPDVESTEEPVKGVTSATDTSDAQTPETNSTETQTDTLDTAKSEGELYWEQQSGKQPAKKKVRLALCAEKETSRQYLSRLLESYGFDVVKASPLGAEEIKALNPVDLNILLIDRTEDGTPLPAEVANVLSSWNGPVLYNDTTATAISLKQEDPNFGQLLADRIHSLAEAS